MEKFTLFIQLLLANWQQALIGGVIVSCSIIFVMGILKKLALGKIKNKLLRKIVLAFSSVALVFPAVAIYFVSDNIAFDNYWYSCAISSITTVFTYWLYENTGLRNLITLIGSKTVGSWIEALRSCSANEAEIQNALSKTTEELKEEIKKDIKNHVKKDDELKDE